ncbi:MAG: hypothetical protein JWM68_3186 [Verrucomicrobiales bacterium]|nr:hypothetical protein [Verrucomicrobiales bacterium]
MFLLLAVFFFATRPKPPRIVYLTDGSRVTVASVECGQTFHMFHGSSLQESLNKILGDKVSYKIVGSKSSMPAAITNSAQGSLGLTLRRSSNQGFLASTWNGHQLLALLDTNGVEIAGLQRQVHFDTGSVNEKTKITTEQVLWEFPFTSASELRFRLYDTNATTQIVYTNDFVLKNPAGSQ